MNVLIDRKALKLVATHKSLGLLHNLAWIQIPGPSRIFHYSLLGGYAEYSDRELAVLYQNTCGSKPTTDSRKELINNIMLLFKNTEPVEFDDDAVRQLAEAIGPNDRKEYLFKQGPMPIIKSSEPAPISEFRMAPSPKGACGMIWEALTTLWEPLGRPMDEGSFVTIRRQAIAQLEEKGLNISTIRTQCAAWKKSNIKP